MRNKLAIKRTAISSRSAHVAHQRTAAAIHHRCTVESIRINARAVLKCYYVACRTNEKLFTDNASARRREGHSDRRGERFATAKETHQFVGYFGATDLWPKRPDTDSRKLQAVSHNLGIRSTSTSRSAIAASAVVTRFETDRTNVFIKQRVCDARKLHP